MPVKPAIIRPTTSHPKVFKNKITRPTTAGPVCYKLNPNVENNKMVMEFDEEINEVGNMMN